MQLYESESRVSARFDVKGYTPRVPWGDLPGRAQEFYCELVRDLLEHAVLVRPILP